SSARVFLADVETMTSHLGRFDLVFHCGVLYHLMHPVEHLEALAKVCSALFLDTHVARDERRMRKRDASGFIYRGAYHGEGGWKDPFSGKDTESFWLTRKSLEAALRRAGFHSISVIEEERAERNGPRLALLAQR